MPMQLSAYFENKRTAAKALRRYAQIARDRNWTIRDSKLGLYRLGKMAFGEAAENGRSAQAFDEIYGNLRRYWQVFRGAKTYWKADQVYRTFRWKCEATNRLSALTLKCNLLEPVSLRAIKRHLEAFEGIKELRLYYPTMPVSKFSHFFNPGLFPIYDTAVVYNMTLKRVFEKDWQTFNPPLPAGFRLQGKDGIWDAFYWIVWGNDLIRRSDAGLMEYFAEWFIRETKVAGDGVSDLAKDLKHYYAAAFEFIAIGACYLNL